MTRLYKTKMDRFIDVDVYGSSVRVCVDKRFVEDAHGSTVFDFKMSKRETTAFIKMLKSQRGRKGIR